MTEKMTITVYLAEGEEAEMAAKYALCGRCDGRGVTSLHGAAITADEWNGPDWDDDMRADYMAGVYDTPCPACHGKRVVLVADEERAIPAHLEAYRAQLRDDAEQLAEERWERRQLGGGY